MGAEASEQRHVKGLNRRGVVAVLRVWARAQGAPPGGWPPSLAGFMGPERVMATSWYPLPVFLDALDLWHRVVMDGSDAAAIRMGELGARQNANVHAAAIRPTAHESLAAFPRAWRRNFDFGELVVDATAEGAQVAFRGYDDIGPVHGLLHVGWFKALVELSGAQGAKAEPLTRPWIDGEPLRIALTFRE
ncbi:MAG: hypothetical protein AAGH15_23395 [Myxococcota bacterium]